MKSRTGAVVVVLAALVCGLAFSQDPPSPDPVASRIDKLELELSATKLRVEALSTEVADAKKQVSAAVKYVEHQAKAAAAMVEVLDQAEKAGFTYGINPDSRHLLLSGWREQLAAAQKDVPEVLAAPQTQATGKRTPKR